MDIRTKLVFALVTVALGSMIVLGTFMYRFTNRQLKESRIEQLEGLAESISEGLEQVSSGWEDRVRLIANRNELREILLADNLEGSPDARARVRQILGDVRRAVPSVASLAVYDAEGRFVGSAGWGTESDLSEEMATLLDPAQGVVYQLPLSPEHEDFRIAYAAALTSDGTSQGDLVGVLQVRFHPGPLARPTRNRQGLGTTGEVLIAVRDADGAVRIPRRSRPDTPPSWEEVETRGLSDPVSRAMSGEEGPYYEGMIDGNGQEVWAAIRYLPATQWALVVKIDAEAARAPAIAYRNYLTNVVISLAALAILFGTVLGLHFAKPIHDLARAAERIKDGDLSVRAPANTQDEVGHLARNFNQMAESLENQVSLLREFQNYFDLSIDMLCIAGVDGYFKRVNPAFEKTLGWSTEELLSRRFLDFVAPEDLEKTENEILRLGKGLPTISFENRYQCQDGTVKYLAWTAHPEPETGMIYAIARDVTALREEREEAEKRIGNLKELLKKAEAKLRGDL